MLIRSLEPGRISTFAPFDTFRSSLSDFSTVWKESIKGVLEVSSLGEDHRRKTVLAKFITHTVWFDRFVIEVQLRVGSNYILDQEISI